MLHVFGNSNPRSILYILGGVAKPLWFGCKPSFDTELRTKCKGLPTALSSTLVLRPEGSKVEGKLSDIL